jgi:hypothetical protein
MKLAAVVAMLLAAPDLVACVCANSSQSPACQLTGRDVIFVGTPISDEGSPLNRAHTYRFAVDKAYKGLDPSLREVWVSSGGGSSCDTTYVVGTRYLMFASGSPGQNGQRALVSMQCSGSRELRHAVEDLRFLDAWAWGETASRVFGTVVQSPPFRLYNQFPNEEAPVANARVTLTSDGEELRTVTRADGLYHFENVAPGEYEVSATLDTLGSSTRPEKVTVLKGGCGVADLVLEPRTRLAGKVVDSSGKPLGGVAVQLVHRGASGKWHAEYRYRGTTDSEGRFEFERVPTGEYRVAFGMATDRGALEDASAVYYPGVRGREKAATLRVDADQPVEGLVLRLPAPSKP